MCRSKNARLRGLRRGFLTCAAGAIDKSRCVSYFPTTPNPDKPEPKFCQNAQDFVVKCLRAGRFLEELKSVNGKGSTTTSPFISLSMRHPPLRTSNLLRGLVRLIRNY